MITDFLGINLLVNIRVFLAPLSVFIKHLKRRSGHLTITNIEKGLNRRSSCHPLIFMACIYAKPPYAKLFLSPKRLWLSWILLIVVTRQPSVS